MLKRVPGLLTVAAAVVVVFLVITGEPTAADRAESLAERLRCPVCQSESVAGSTSQTARDMQALIEERLAAGASDDEVIDFFASRYGEWIILDAPASGRTLILWLLPAIVAVGGVVVIAGRRRGANLIAPSADVIEEDRADLARQVALGEVDEDTALRLLATYETEVAAAPKPSAARSRLPRIITGTAILVIGVAAVVFAVVKAIEDRPPGGFATGGVAAEAPPDLSSVSNEELEAVIAANPDVVPMRLALARRYFNAGDFSAALPHYLSVLEIERDPEALANLGWMAYLNDHADVAAGYLEESLAVAPDYLPAQWFLANVRLFGLEDPAGAEPLIRKVLEADGVPDDIRATAEGMLEQATTS